MQQQLDRAGIEALVRQVLLEKLGAGGAAASSGIVHVSLGGVALSEADRLDTGRPQDRVWTHDLFTLEQSPRLGAGLMLMEKSSFPWKLDYDEIDYVLEGRLEIICNGQKQSAGPGELLLIPKGSAIEFSAPDRARFLYFVYPADWQNQKS